MMNSKYKEDISGNILQRRIQNNEVVLLKGNRYDTLVGKGLQLKINSSVGSSNEDYLSNEEEKILSIANFDIKPDTMMDLSIISLERPLYHIIQEQIGCPVGTVPAYVCFDDKVGIDRNRLLDEIEKQAQNGVAFMTFHFTAVDEIYKKSYKRNVPIISRGGSIVLRDLYMNKRNNNILLENLVDICKILKKYSVVASIGTAFRPSTLYDALDEVQLSELKMQKDMAKTLMRNGITVMMEGVGHISLKDLSQYVQLIREDFYVPFMPLGPIVTDRAIGWDHISAAIGSSHMAFLNGADIINAVTREEHTGGIPSIDSIYEAIKSAQIVVNAINDVRFFEDFNPAKIDAENNCMGIKKISVGCDRCKNECPFWLSKNFPM